MTDTYESRFQVEVLPPQPEQLAQPHPGESSRRENRPVVRSRGGEELGDLLRSENPCLSGVAATGSLAPREPPQRRLEEQPLLEGVRKQRREDGVDATDRPIRK